MINRIFQIRGKRINYKLENFSDLSEQKAIDAALGCAFNMAQLILHNLKTADAKTAQSMQKIYGESADAQTLSEAFKKIIEHIEHKFFVRREKIFAGENGEEMPEVFTSADRDTQKIIIYDAYFKTVPGDESGLNDRPSVLIHEMAHLNGFKGDAELGDINSAEALRNFALLACGLVDENLLFEKIRAAEQDDDLQGEDGELPYRPDQPRAPKGQPNGGQWIEDNSSPNGGKSQNNAAQKNPPAKNTDSGKSAAVKSEDIKDSSREKKNEMTDPSKSHICKGENAMPSDKYEKAYNKIKAVGGDEPAALVGEINEDRTSSYDFKTETECGTTEIKVVEREESSKYAGEWYAEDVLVGNLPPNSEVSFDQHMTYEYRDKDGNSHTEEADFLLKGKTDANGMALFPRVGIHYQSYDTEAGEADKPYKDVNIKMEISHLKDGVPEGVNVDKNSNFKYRAPNGLKEYAKQHSINNGGGEIEKGSNLGRRQPILNRKYRLPERNSRQ